MYYTSAFVCFSGIIILFSIYAYQQENLLADKSRKIDTFLVLGIQNFVAAVLAGLVCKVFNLGSISQPTQEDLLVGGLLFGSTFSSNYSLKYVNYPFMVLAKSAKVVPIALVGALRGTYKLQTQ